MKNISLLLYFLFACFVISCTPNKEVSKVDTSDCQTLATVKDFTGLDGCGLMIVLDNGDKLIPSSINDPNFTLREGQRIKISYTELEDMLSSCMAEKATVDITCIELIEGKPIVKKCHDTTDLTIVPWMKEVVETTRPNRVIKYKYRTDGWAYLFMNDKKQLFYDCQGTLICEHEGDDVNPCLNRYVPGEEGKVIFSMRQ